MRITEFDQVDRESSLAIHLAIGISRGERMIGLKKATELGVVRSPHCLLSAVK